jgi:uncharacterized protein YjiS (DUF1127 family)
MRNLDLLPGGELAAEMPANQPSLSLAADLAGFARWLISPPVDLCAALARAWRHNREIRLLTQGGDPMLRDLGLTRGDLHGIMAEPWFGRSRRQLLRAAAERRNTAIERAKWL